MASVAAKPKFERENLPILHRVAKVRLARLMKYRGMEIRHIDWGRITSRELDRRLAELCEAATKEKKPCTDSLNRDELDVVLEPMEKAGPDKLTWKDTVAGPIPRPPATGVCLVDGQYEARPYLWVAGKRKRVYCGRYATKEEALDAVARLRAADGMPEGRTRLIPARYLTDEEVRAIRRLIARGVQAPELARFYRRKVSCIRDIAAMRVYRWVEEEGGDASHRYLDQLRAGGDGVGPEGAARGVRQDCAGPPSGGPGPEADPAGG